jgi:hypothetical protein
MIGKYLRIAMTALSLTACVLFVALWVRSYWYQDTVNCPLERLPVDASGRMTRSRKMLILNSYQGRLSLYVGTRDFSSTGWFPSEWDVDTTPVNKLMRPLQAEPYWSHGSNHVGRWFLFPHWLPVVVAGTLAALIVVGTPRRFSLRTLLIATTLVAILLGPVVYSAT